MSKQLYVIRHAKSSWDDSSLSDFERPLNKRGKHDAPMMAKRLSEKISFDCIVTSTAKRAMQTAEYFKKEMNVSSKNFFLDAQLYLAPASKFYEVIKGLEDKYDSVAIVSHNDGITEFVNTLCNTHVDDMPTCSVFSVKADIKSWKDFEEAKRLFVLFDYPKNT